MKFYLDEDVHEDIALALRLRGYDVRTTREAGNKGLTDAEQLRYAISEGRIIISFNAADFYKLHSELLKKGIEHNGIILSKQLPIGKVIKSLLKLISDIKDQDIRNNILWLNE